jgi:hypothetical protein
MRWETLEVGSKLRAILHESRPDRLFGRDSPFIQFSELRALTNEPGIIFVPSDSCLHKQRFDRHDAHREKKYRQYNERDVSRGVRSLVRDYY